MEKTLLKALNQGQVDRVVRLLLPSFINNSQICIDTMRKALSEIEIYVQEEEYNLIDPVCITHPLYGCLSYEQQQMYTLYKMNPSSTSYNITSAWKCLSSLQPNALKKACESIMWRHPMLRAHFEFIAHEPRQVIQSEFELPLTILTDLPHHVVESDQTLTQFIQLRTDVPFDLEQQIPIRFYALKSTSTWVLIVVVHHIATDALSSERFETELLDSYMDYCRNPEKEIIQQSNSSITYVDFAIWERQRIHSEEIAQQIQYWATLLEGDLPRLDLPLDYQRPDEPAFRGSSVQFCSTPISTTILQGLCSELNASPFMALLGIYNILLCRLSSCQELIIGCPTSGRNHSAVQQLVGYFVKTLPFRLKLHEDMSFRDYLIYVRDEALQVYEHMDVPFNKILENTRVERVLYQNPIFQAMFAWVDGKQRPENLTQWQRLEMPNQSAKFDIMLTMTLNCNENGNAVFTGTMQFAEELFQHKTVERFASYFCEILDAVTRDPTSSLQNICMLSPHERSILLRPSRTPHIGKHDFVDYKFEYQAKQTPNDIALHFENQSITYSELYTRALMVKHELLILGVPVGCHIGIFLERGFNVVAGILGTLMFGSPFVPLDLSCPQDRVDYMIQDSQIQCILTERRLEKQLDHLSLVHLLYLDEIRESLLEIDCPDDSTGSSYMSRSRKTPSQSLAYILYTSGTTGKPKGVMVSHENIISTIEWTIREYDLGDEDMVLQSTPCTLDGSLTQLFPALFVGASVVITKQDGLHDIEYISRLLHSHPITMCVFVPSYFALLIEMYSIPEHVKRIVLAGESFSTSLAHKFYTTHPHTTTCLINEYGPTEAAVTSSFYKVAREDSIITSTVPIGQGIDHHHLYVLDRFQRLVPQGVAGELYVSGRGVARGYWNQPVLNRDRFIQTSFAPDILYRTGDRVRILASGDLVFLGRLDSQVKLRGMRIEVLEIQAVLLSHKDVHDAEVILHQDQLLGFVICSKDIEADLLHLCSTKLLHHMIPSRIYHLKVWPRTPNGKLDTMKLLQLTTSAKMGTLNTRITSVEEIILKQAWRETLGISTIQSNDSFFQLGGNSLLGIQLIAIAKSYGLCLNLSHIFRCKSLHEMAEACRYSIPGPSSVLVPLNTVKRADPIYFIHCIDGTVWNLANLANLLPFPCIGIQATHLGRIQSVEILAEQYWNAIRTQQSDGPYRFGGYSFGCRVAFAMAHLATSQGYDVGPLILLDAMPFSLDDKSKQPDASTYIERIFGQKMAADMQYHLTEHYTAHLKIDSTYRPNYHVATGVHLFKTTHWEADATVLAARFGDFYTIHTVPGTHHTMLQSPHVEQLAIKISNSMRNR